MTSIVRSMCLKIFSADAHLPASSLSRRQNNLAVPCAILAALLCCTRSSMAPAQSTNTAQPGFVPSSESFGAINIGAASSVQTLTYVFGADVTLGSIRITAQGASGLDFADAGSDTCAAKNAYTAGQSCTVNVVFTPKVAGTRYGAVTLNDNNRNGIAIAYLQGIGVGPQVIFSPGAPITAPDFGFNAASGIAIDGSGNAYIANTIDNSGYIQEVMIGGGPSIPGGFFVAALTLDIGLDCPGGPALDAAGNVYFFDVCDHTVSELRTRNGGFGIPASVATLTNQIVSPAGIAVDGGGNVYVLDASNKTVNELVAVNGGVPASPAIVTLASGFNEVDGIAVDSNGNVYVSDDTSHAVFEIHAINGSIPASPLITSVGNGFVAPRGIAVDGAGNVYVADSSSGTVYEMMAVSGTLPDSPVIQTLGTGFVNANGVAVDGNRNVYVTDYGNGSVVKLDYADPPSLTFATTAFGVTSADSPQTVTVENVGNAALSFPVLSTGNNPSVPANFTLNSGMASACPLIGAASPAAGTLTAGASCQLSISFTPAEVGDLTGSLLITDSNLNAAAPAYASQSITLSGTSIQATPALTWVTPRAITYGSPLSRAQLNARSNTIGSFTYSPAAGTVLGAGQQTLTVVFTPTDSTDYATATAMVTLVVNRATPKIQWAPPKNVHYGVPLSERQLNARSAVAGTFTYSPAAGTVLSLGRHTLTATFTPADSADYTIATDTVTLIVDR